MVKPGEGAEPVFVDRTGRRSRLFAAVGFAGGTALVLATAGLLAGFTGVGAGVLPGLPASRPSPAVAGQPGVVTQLSPRPTAPAAVRPGAGRTTTPTVTPSPLATPSDSPSPTSRRNVPTQTPSHGNKKKP